MWSDLASATAKRNAIYAVVTDVNEVGTHAVEEGILAAHYIDDKVCITTPPREVLGTRIMQTDFYKECGRIVLNREPPDKRLTWLRNWEWTEFIGFWTCIVEHVILVIPRPIRGDCLVHASSLSAKQRRGVVKGHVHRLCRGMNVAARETLGAAVLRDAFSTLRRLGYGRQIEEICRSFY